LQNVIERSVVIHRYGELAVRECCLSDRASYPTPGYTSLRRSTAEDRKVIDSALAETGGRVSGPLGAAALLGIPPSTLESKIKAMNINKYSFKTSDPSLVRSSQNHEKIDLL
jgi:DNA-binding NtrC family response regulator